MRVALDAQLTVGTATGIGEYVRGLSGALRRRGIDAVELCEPRLDPWRFDRRVVWDQVLLPRRARASGADLLHCAAGTVPFHASLPVVATVHDVAWFEAQDHAPAYARYYFGRFSLARYRTARRVVTDSAFSRDALLRLLRDVDPDTVHAIHPGVSSEFGELNRERGDGRTILAVGTVERRKNLEVLVRALATLDGARLVAVGPQTPYARECAALAAEMGVADRFELCGYVERERLLSLYRTCAVAAVPSLYEGFGYAAAQALCAGVPCVVSDRTSLPEVSGGDATVVEASDAPAWAAALDAALRGERDERAAAARARSVERFSWETSAGDTARVYAAALGGSA